jgi:arsenate reductase
MISIKRFSADTTIASNMSVLVVSSAVLAASVGADQAVSLVPPVRAYIEARASEFEQISPERRERLTEIARFVRTRVAAGETARLTFICTHNSRRSHLARIWAQVTAAHYGVGGVETFSGGTEATAFNPRAVSALRRAGFSISTPEPGAQDNPRYQVHFAESASPLTCFSKIYDQEPNPKKDFCAVMTCSLADQSCPLVAGASLRIAIPYEDPKAFDGTPEEAQQYDERCRQIAREMLYVFSQVGR